MKDFETTTKEERDAFIKSFDYVLCDTDGVMWMYDPDISSALENLRKLGKKMIYISNNSIDAQYIVYNELASMIHNLEPTDLIFPITVIVDYLKKSNFSKRIFLIGLNGIRRELENAGFRTEKLRCSNSEENFQCTEADSDEVGAVVVDWDPNVTGPKLEMALSYLKDPSVLFITGGLNKKLSFRRDEVGPGMYHELLEDISGRKPLCFVKHENHFNSFIREKFQICDSFRVLVIVDSVPEDMAFATNNGYQKLLVLCGMTTRDEVENWKFPENCKPEYYITSLTDLYKCLML